MEECNHIYGKRNDLVLCENANQALEGSDALIIVTEWTEFRSPDYNHIKSTLTYPVIFDGRNLYDPAYLKDQHIEYFAIGRGDSVKKFN